MVVDAIGLPRCRSCFLSLCSRSSSSSSSASSSSFCYFFLERTLLSLKGIPFPSVLLVHHQARGKGGCSVGSGGGCNRLFLLGVCQCRERLCTSCVHWRRGIALKLERRCSWFVILVLQRDSRFCFILLLGFHFGRWLLISVSVRWKRRRRRWHFLCPIKTIPCISCYRIVFIIFVTESLFSTCGLIAVSISLLVSSFLPEVGRMDMSLQEATYW